MIPELHLNTWSKIYRNIQVEHIKNSAQIKKLMNEFDYLDFIRCPRNMVQEAHNLCYELGEKLVLKQALKEVYCSLDKKKEEYIDLT